MFMVLFRVRFVKRLDLRMLLMASRTSGESVFQSTSYIPKPLISPRLGARFGIKVAR